MKRTRPTPARILACGLILAAFGLNLTPLGPWGMSQARAETETVRPEVGKPLQAAQELMKARKYKEALGKLQEADSAAGKTPYENFVIERTRVAIASASGDDALIVRSLEVVIASGRLSAGDHIKFIQALAGSYYRLKDYPKAIAWLSRYVKDGGDDPKIHNLLTQSYYLNGDYARAAQDLRTALQADEKAGRAPAEEQLQLLASCALKQNDKAGYANALEKFVAYYPKKEYWSDLLSRVQTKPGFADRLALDVYRLKLAVGQLNAADEYMEMSQLALQAGFPAEASNIVDQGFQSGVLGKGPEVSRQKRLQSLAAKSAADDLKTMGQGEADAVKSKEGTGLVNLGYAYVTTGQFDKGIGLMEQGIRAGGLKRAEDAKLHMATAYALAGRKSSAIQMFKTVQGSDGTADLARYWVMQLNHPMR